MIHSPPHMSWNLCRYFFRPPSFLALVFVRTLFALSFLILLLFLVLVSVFVLVMVLALALVLLLLVLFGVVS